ncbi:GIY-YIG nuclease family protein [Candidatus Parcubacteria bacterium]|nr:GIY-YIG nuclease family protein [Patescibacteria group bacterium]MCG2689561.1 GIY-YIG nuclease family protein [Candidatus Parcubacteria bacterium]
MYYVYIIQSVSNPNKTYVGYTEDLKKRIFEHNIGANKSTENFKPWKLLSYIALTDKYQALQLEKYLKQGSGKAFMNKHLITISSPHEQL